MRTREIKSHLHTVATRVFGGPHPVYGKLFRDEGLIVAGGVIASLLRGEEVSDYDFFAKSLQSRNLILEEAARNLGNTDPLVEDSDGVLQVDWDKVGASKLKGHYSALGGEATLTKNALTVENVSTGKTIQIIFRHWGQAFDIVNEFDFAHCMCSYDTKEKYLSLPTAAVQSLLTGELKYIGNYKPLSSLTRMQKFLPRGYTISKSEVLKIALDLSTQDLRDPDTLLEQLEGAYGGFHTLQEVLRRATGDKTRNLSDETIEITNIFGPNLLDAEGKVDINQFTALVDHVDEEIVLVEPAHKKDDQLIF